MKSIQITNGVVEYYGNKVGIIKDQKAAIDEMFRKPDLEEFLTAQQDLQIVWKDGVYDRLINGEPEQEAIFKKCRIYQLKPDVDIRIKFIGYSELEKRGFGKPDMRNYRVVFDGDVGTDNPEEIYTLFNQDKKPEGFSGYSLSVSDVIELYDEIGSELQYVDKFGFVKLNDEPEPAIRQENQNESLGEAIQQDMLPAEENTKKQKISTDAPIKKEQENTEEFHVETFKISM